MTVLGLALTLMLAAPQDRKPLEEQDFSELTTDDKDGAFDVSKYLLTRGIPSTRGASGSAI